MATKLLDLVEQNNVATEPTVEFKKTQFAANYLRDVVHMKETIVRQLNDLHRRFWNNPQGLTPQECADALGANTAAVFTLNSELAGVFERNSSTVIPGVPENWTYSFNKSGVCTLTYTPPVTT